MERKNVPLTQVARELTGRYALCVAIVPIHSSASKKLAEYAKFRDQYHSMAKSKSFFVSETGQKLSYSTVNHTFKILRKKLGWCTEGKRPPRIQDMRHTFTCRRLLLWYEQGVDINYVIYSLSTYLGHVKVTDKYATRITYVDVSPIPYRCRELLKWHPLFGTYSSQHGVHSPFCRYISSAAAYWGF